MIDSAVLLLSEIGLQSGALAFVALFLLILALVAPVVHIRS